MAASKAVVKHCDMPQDMLDCAWRDCTLAPRRHRWLTARPLAQVWPPALCLALAVALDQAYDAIDRYNTDKEVAQAVRNAFVRQVRTDGCTVIVLVLHRKLWRARCVVHTTDSPRLHRSIPPPCVSHDISSLCYGSTMAYGTAW